MAGKNGEDRPDPRQTREERLAEALRLNLRRRKAAGRGAAAVPGMPAEAQKSAESGPESGSSDRS